MSNAKNAAAASVAAAPAPNPFAGFAPNKPKPVKTVRVTVRAILKPTGWAGRVWPTEPTTIEAVPAEVADLLKAPPALYVQWPDDFVGPNGMKPARAVFDDDAKATMSSGDRVATAEAAAKKAQSQIDSMAAALTEQKAGYEGQLVALSVDLDAAKRRVAELSEVVQAAERNSAGAAADLSAATEAHAKAIDAMAQRHKGEVDSLKAAHEADLTKANAELERMQAEIERLNAALDAATAPAAKPAPASKPAASKNNTPAAS